MLMWKACTAMICPAQLSKDSVHSSSLCRLTMNSTSLSHQQNVTSPSQIFEIDWLYPHQLLSAHRAALTHYFHSDPSRRSVQSNSILILTQKDLSAAWNKGLTSLPNARLLLYPKGAKPKQTISSQSEELIFLQKAPKVPLTVEKEKRTKKTASLLNSHSSTSSMTTSTPTTSSTATNNPPSLTKATHGAVSQSSKYPVSTDGKPVRKNGTNIRRKTNRKTTKNNKIASQTANYAGSTSTASASLSGSSVRVPVLEEEESSNEFGEEDDVVDGEEDIDPSMKPTHDGNLANLDPVIGS